MARKELTPPAGMADLALLLVQDMKDLYGARNVMMGEMRARREQTRDVDIPKAYKTSAREVKLSLLADTVDLMTAIVNDAQWHVHVDPYEEKPMARRNSSARERWSEAAIEQCIADLCRPVLDNVAYNQMGDGQGVVKVVYRPDHWSELPTTKSLFGKRADELQPEEANEYGKSADRAKKGAKLPFTLIDVDPLTVFPVYGPDGELQCVLEICDRPARAMMLQYNDKIGMGRDGKVAALTLTAGQARPLSEYERSTDPQSTVEFVEYWDREWHITFVESVIVKVSHHGYGRPPYFFCWAKPNPSRKPEVASRPPGYKTKWLLDMLDSLWTMMGNVGVMFSYPTPVTTTPLGTNVAKGKDGRPLAHKWKVGEHVILYEGQEFRFETPPVEHLQMLDKLIERGHTMYDATTGLGPAMHGQGSSDNSGYALNQLMQASMLTLKPAIKSRDMMIAEVVRFLWRLVEKRIKDTVYVWGTEPDPEPGVKGHSKTWLSLGPKDIAGYYKVEVESKPLVDQMRIARGQFALGMVKGRLLDRRRAIEDFLGYEDPDGIMDDIWVDEVIETPGPIKDMTVNNALKRAGYIQPQPPQPQQGPMPMPQGQPIIGPDGQPLAPSGQGGMMQGVAGPPPLAGMPQQPVAPGVGMPQTPPQGMIPLSQTGVADQPQQIQPQPIQPMA